MRALAGPGADLAAGEPPCDIQATPVTALRVQRLRFETQSTAFGIFRAARHAMLTPNTHAPVRSLVMKSPNVERLPKAVVRLTAGRAISLMLALALALAIALVVSAPLVTAN
jgi:hypothetical protein